MIVKFSVQNFSSIKEVQTLSFEADKSKHLEDHYIIKSDSGQRLLKLGLIYGTNASGKTNILLALEFLRELILDPEEKKTESLDFEPFLFDPKTPLQNSLMTIEFIKGTIKYHYEIEFNKRSIVREELLNYDPNKAIVYKRVTDPDNQVAIISFGNKAKIKRETEKALATNTLWNNSVLGGYLKTNAELKDLKNVTDWFSDYLTPIILTRTDLEGYVTTRIDNSEIKKSDIINILKKADLNISDLVLNKEENDIPDGFLEFLEKQTKGSTDRIDELKKKGKFTSVNLQFEHTVNNEKYYLPADYESHGTMRYYGFAGILSLLIRESVAVSIDELEASLHPDLYVHFLLSFLTSSSKSQLIATTHNREILNNKDLFRNDAIWFTEKEDNCATELYSLSDFDSSVIRDTSNILNAYKYGKLGAIPNLGDYFIELSNEEK